MELLQTMSLTHSLTSLGAQTVRYLMQHILTDTETHTTTKSR